MTIALGGIVMSSWRRLTNLANDANCASHKFIPRSRYFLSKFSKEWWAAQIDFACLGLGFIMCEMALLSQFTLYLGQLIYTYGIVLGGLLVFAGIGAALRNKVVIESGVSRIRPHCTAAAGLE
jgi:hypothetical protein